MVLLIQVDRISGLHLLIPIMGGEPAVSLQMNRLSNNRLKFKTAGKLLIIFRGIYRIYPNLIEENPEDVNM